MKTRANNKTVNTFRIDYCRIWFWVLLSACTNLLIAQGSQYNSEKYWIYRERLNADYIIIGSNQGNSIPAEFSDDDYEDPGGQFHDLAGLKVKVWSDASAHLGYYIGMLATERRVLELSGDPTNQTDQELYYALNALWRIDATSGYYGYDSSLYSSGTCFTPNWPIPVMDGSNFENANMLDGFFIRDDVPADFAQHWPDIDAFSSNLIVRIVINAGERRRVSVATFTTTSFQ